MKNFIKISRAVLIALLIIEACLRLLPSTLPMRLADFLYHKYYRGAGGIYYFNSQLGIELMKPSFKTKMFWNGYRWNHSTDTIGFRNPQTYSRADIVILGDSLAYGHGVEEVQTLGHFLREDMHWGIVNLGQQGICAYQEYLIFRKFGIRLKPKIVILILCDNDIDELSNFLTPREMKQIINSPPSQELMPNEKLSHQDSKFILLKDIKNSSMALKLLQYMYKSILQFRVSQIRYCVMEKKQNALYYSVGGIELQNWQCAKKLYLKIRYLCNSLDATLIMIGAMYNGELVAKMRDFCQEERIPFVNFFDREFAISCIPNEKVDYSSLFLKNDGHFSEKGHRALAKIIECFISQNNLFSL
jgi:hypothetical protein